MNNITNEQLDVLIKSAVNSSGTLPPDEKFSQIISALRELRDLRASILQGADNELQRKAAIYDALCKKYNVESLADFVDWQRNHIAELEAAPPAPVGKGETAVMPDYPGYTTTQRECYQAGKKAGLAEAGNSPVIQDCWVSCSERMPEREVDVQVYCADKKEQMVGYMERNERNGYFRFASLRNGGGVYCQPTHWMPLPAAPQQEA